jgi:hypothetical protein
VSYVGETDCASATQMPCNSGVLKKAISAVNDGVLDIDVPAVKVSGTATLKGGALPASEAAELLFGASATTGQLTGGSATYNLVLLPNTYDVTYLPVVTCETATTMPCNTGVLKKAAVLMIDGVLDLDIPVVQVTGKLTVKGGALPASESARLSFGAAHTTLLNLGAPNYSILLLPGTYDVSYDGSSSCNGATASVLPCNSGVVKSAVALSTSGVLDVDVQPVTVSGTVTLKGAALPTGEQAHVTFSGTTVGPAKSATLGAQSTYTMTLLQGTYDVTYNGDPSGCTGVAAPQFPCLDGPLKQAVALTNNGVLDLDIPAISVSGNVTLAGQTLPTQPDDRGAIEFGHSGGIGTSAQLGTSGPGNYHVTLLPGNYVVQLRANGAACSGSNSPGVSCNDEILAGCP